MGARNYSEAAVIHRIIERWASPEVDYYPENLLIDLVIPEMQVILEAKAPRRWGTIRQGYPKGQTQITDAFQKLADKNLVPGTWWGAITDGDHWMTRTYTNGKPDTEEWDADPDDLSAIFQIRQTPDLEKWDWLMCGNQAGWDPFYGPTAQCARKNCWAKPGTYLPIHWMAGTKESLMKRMGNGWECLFCHRT